MIVEPVALAAAIRERIREANDLGDTTIRIPEWGVTLVIKSFTIGERKEFREQIALNEDEAIADQAEAMDRQMLKHCVYTQSGERLFTSDEDLDLLLDKAAHVVQRLVDAAAEASGLGDNSVEEAEKN